MHKYTFMTLGLLLCCAAVAFGQGQDTPFQVHHATHLKQGDAAIYITNSGASSTVASPQNGKLCANVYGFAPTGPLLACCSCLIPPNGLVSLSVWKDLLFPPPDTMVIKLMASAGSVAADCDASKVGTTGHNLTTGMLAWETNPQPAGLGATAITETTFVPATLSAAELTSLNTQCGVLHPSFNICASCP